MSIARDRWTDIDMFLQLFSKIVPLLTPTTHQTCPFCGQNNVHLFHFTQSFSETALKCGRNSITIFGDFFQRNKWLELNSSCS